MIRKGNMKESHQTRILMLLENNSYPQDSRVRQEATSLTTAGYKVTVISPKESDQRWHEDCNNIEVYRFPAPPEANGFLGYILEYGYSIVATFFFSLFIFLKHGFDIIHAHNPPDIFVLIAIFYKILGKKFVFDQHDLSPEMYFARFSGEGNQIVYKALLFFERLSYFFADHLIATNESYKKIQIQRGNVPEDRITIVRNGPNLHKIPQIIDSNSPANKKSTIVYVGDMGYHDGVDYLLRSLQCLKKDLNRNDFNCVLVGAGDAYESIKSLAQSLNLTNDINFTGWVDHNEVKNFLQVADICVAPEPSNSYNDKSTMIKIMEYMAFAKPIVAFDLPEHRVTAQDSAIYAKPNEELDFARKIVLLMNDPEQRRKMGMNGRKRIESKLCWSYQASRLLEVYTKQCH